MGSLPGLQMLRSEASGDPRIKIAVIDGPVDRSHSCFTNARLQPLATLVPDAPGQGRMSAHGTHVASMIFGTDSVLGLAPACTGLIAPIYSDEPGRASASQLDLARAIGQALAAGAQLLNISGGELGDPAEASAPLVSAIEACESEGALIVAAAGNDGCACLHVPAALPAVLAVGAMDEKGEPLESSNWGDAYQANGILAPGSGMRGANPGGGIALRSGTSFATPVVTGVIALLMSVLLKRGLNPDPHTVRDALLASALPCVKGMDRECTRLLAGRINIPGAYEALLSPGRRTVMSYEVNAASSTGSASVAQPVSVDRPGPLIASPDSQNAAPRSPALARSEDGPPPIVPTADLGAPSGATVRESRPRVSGNENPALRRRLEAAFEDIFDQQHSQQLNIIPSADCGCSAKGSPSLVYAIGSLGYDFGTEARRDAFKQLMPRINLDGTPFMPQGRPAQPPLPPNPYDARQMVNYLSGYPQPVPPFPTEGGLPALAHAPALFPPPLPEPPANYPGYPSHLSEAAELIWTLNIEYTPIYALRPSGSFMAEVYQRLVAFLAGQIRNPDEDSLYVSRVSIPGMLTGETVRLFTGQVVPVIVPSVRGMYAWNENLLVGSVLEQMQLSDQGEKDQARGGLRNFLDRVYYDLRNLGQNPADRALNFAATNAFQAATVFGKPAVQGMFLDTILVERSAFCRMDSDCWDVKLRFFDPENDQRARKIYRFTVDVSAEFPVTVGPIREWMAAR